MKQTAMQLLIAKLNRMPERQIKIYLLMAGDEYLQAEKQQIMNAYIDGEQSQGYEDEANLYYNQTYLEESKQKP